MTVGRVGPRDQEEFEAGRTAGGAFASRCENNSVSCLIGEVLRSTLVTAVGLPGAVFSVVMFGQESRNQMENDTFQLLDYASDIFNRIFKRGDNALVGVVAPRVREKLRSWSWQALEHQSAFMQQAGSRIVFALSAVFLAVAHVADAIIGVTVGIASVVTARHFYLINQVADRAFCGWPKIVRDTVFCALRVLRPATGVNPLVQLPL